MRHLTPLSLSLLLIIAGFSFAEAPSACSWDVTADTRTGTLEMSIEPQGLVSGTLLGQPVGGSLVGRHLVLVRQGPEGPEHWDGWIATDNPSDTGCPAVAGTFTRPGSDGSLPWFGTGTTGDDEAPRRVSVEPVIPRRNPTPVPPTAAPEPSPTAAPLVIPVLADGRISFAGTWLTPDGLLEIRQEGSRLTFVLPDREVSGRVIGSDTLIGGFGPGCCKGTVEQGFTVIAWDNGARWSRK